MVKRVVRMLLGLREMLIIALILLIFISLLGKYFFPFIFPKTWEPLKTTGEMEEDYKRYKAEFLEYKNNFGGSINERRERATSIPILVYHGISDYSRTQEETLVPNFKDHMFALKAAGYEAITFTDFFDFMQGKKELPDKSFLLTFDDGIKTSYYNVDPILRALDFRAVMFIITKYSLNKGTKYYLSFKEVKHMVESKRWEMQPHAKDAHNLIQVDEEGTMGHFISNKKWLKERGRLETDEEYRQRLRNEFIDSKKEIEERLGVKAIAFAFPFGDFGQNSINFPDALSLVVEEMKPVYSYANFYQFWPSRGFSYNHPSGESFLIKRLKVSPQWSGRELLDVLEKGKDKVLPYYDDFSKNKGWIRIWGEMVMQNNSLILKSSDSTEGGSVFLDGTYLWKDYKYNAIVKEVGEGDTVSLISKYQDAENYLSCEFKTEKVLIKELRNSETKILREADVGGRYELEGGAKLSTVVKGDEIVCLINDSLILSAKSPGFAKVGGIGAKVWSQDEESTLTIGKVEIEGISNN